MNSRVAQNYGYGTQSQPQSETPKVNASQTQNGEDKAYL